MHTEKEQQLRDLIRSEAFITKDQRRMVTPNGDESIWIFDFRRIFFTPKGLSLAADVFWDRFEKQLPFQVAGLEAAALPIVAAIVMRGLERGHDVNGFFIRKSRNKSGLLNMVEGMPNKERVVLVDDLMNHGGTFLRQIKVLQEAQLPVYALFAYVRYRDTSYYQFAHEAGVKIETVLSLEDFGMPLLPDPHPTLPSDIFKPIWGMRMEGADHFHVVPKSAPALDETRVYMGSDSGHMWALSQEDGSVIWKFKIRGAGEQGKTIFSSPALMNGTVYFGAYDGNMYALDAETGKERWVFEEADWIGSSPAVAADLGLVYVGLEFGLFRKQGGIVALDAQTGAKRWEARFPGLTHGSPAYSRRYGLVAVGSNDGGFYALDATTGALRFKHQADGPNRGRCVFDEERGLVMYGSYDGTFYALSVTDGSVAFAYATGVAIYSSPCIADGKAYFASQDKYVYCIDLAAGSLVWKFKTRARVFASPIVVGGAVYIGSNDGRFYELDANTGTLRGFFQGTERVTTKAAYNERTRRFFVPTFGNELFCLTRADKEQQRDTI